MKVSLVSKGRAIFEVHTLAEELSKRGAKVNIIDPLFSLDDIRDEEWWQPYIGTDILYYRSGLGDAPRTELSRRILETDVRCINSATIHNQLLSNKAYQAIQIAHHAPSVMLPKTLFGRGHEYINVIKNLGEQFILKAANGIQGKSVFLIKSETEYHQVLQVLSGDVIIQECVPNTGDFRVFVVGGTTREIFKRVPKNGDFRANISQGGHGEIVADIALRDRLSQYAEMVVSTLGLDIAGIDLLQHHETGEIFFIESNLNPGWKGLDDTLGTNTSSVVAEFILNQR